MAIVSMKRVWLVGEERFKTDILRDMMWLRSVQICPLEDKLDDPEWIGLLDKGSDNGGGAEYGQRVRTYAKVIDILSPYAKGRRGLFSKPYIMTRGDMDRLESDVSALDGEAERILSLSSNIGQLQTERNSVLSKISSLEPWRDCPIPATGSVSAHTVMLFCTVSSEFKIDNILRAVNDETDFCYAEQLSVDSNARYIAVICLRSKEKQARELVASLGLSCIELQTSSATPEQAISELQAKLADVDARKDKLLDSLRSSAEELEIFERAYDMAASITRMYEAEENLPVTAKTFLLEGWCPVPRVDRFTELCKKYGCCFDVADPEPAQEPPILLKNNVFSSAFEGITEMYALPVYQGIDPTPILAPFYCLFFGMMMADVGYGLLVVLACAVLLGFAHLKSGMRKAVRMFLFCGISTAFWGLMFGSFFGDVIPSFSSTFLGREVPFDPLWISPTEEPMLLLCVSFGLGILHIVVGYGVKFYILCRDGKPFSAVFDAGFWMILYIGLACTLVGLLVPSAPEVLSVIGLSAMGAAMAGLILTQGRHCRNIFAKFGVGLKSVYDLTGGVSDILSYSRIFALGLSTSVIAMVFNELATVFGGGVAGGIIFVIVFVFSTLLNMGLGLLSAYVHSARLQFIEFFSKFYESGGEPFQPLDVQTVYTDIDIKE